MTREQAKEVLPVIEAWAKGEVVEYRYRDRTGRNEDWHKMPRDDSGFNCDLFEYRIKPKPLERWAVVTPDNFVWGLFADKSNAENVLRDNDNWRVVHLREVEEEK